MTRLAQAVATSLPIGADDAETGDDDAAIVVGLAQDDSSLDGCGTEVQAGTAASGEEPIEHGAGSSAGDDLGVRGDALDEAGQDPARTDLDEGGDARRGHPLDDADPVDAGGEVLDELGRQASAVVDRASVGVGEERDGRIVEGDRRRARSRIPSAASAISGRVGRDRDRQDDRALGTERLGELGAGLDGRAARPRRRPGPGRCGWRRRRRRARDAPATSSGSRASSRPMSAAIAPSRPWPEACISRPRSRTRRRPSSSESAPAATRAEYWPIEWPAMKAGVGAASPSAAQRSRSASRIAIEVARIAGWAFSVGRGARPGRPRRAR